MKNKIFIVFLANIVLTMFFACSNPILIPDTLSESESKTKLTISYDDVYRIQKISPIYLFFYDDDGNIVRITGQGESFNFRYNRDTVAVKHLMSSPSIYEGDYFYIINDKGYAEKLITQRSAAHSENVFEYDNVGNLLKVNRREYSMFSSSNEETIYEYDNSNGIFMNINAPKWFFYFLEKYLLNESGFFLSMHNNVIKKTTESAMYSFTNTYTYNKNNYPETIKNSERSSSDLIIHYIERK